VKAGGAARWLNLGGMTFQPAELAKPAIIIYLAYSLSKKQEMIKDFSVGFLPHAIAFLMFSILILAQPDFGSVVVLGLITWGIMFIAGVPVLHLLSPVPLMIPLVYFLVYKVDYRMERILVFLNPWQDPTNAGYQITHSLKAFGSGGILGKGIGQGMQKLHYLPEPHTDFIFSIIGEELGLVGVMAVFALYGTILLRGLKIARNTADSFGSIVAAGVTMSLGLQVIINTGVAMGALPTKGLTLPFLSYGGTSLLVNMAAMGILINIGASRDHD
ncbi:MAG: putative lipid II flippase FtsW, partial [Desulfobacteraceae bacterium]